MSLNGFSWSCSCLALSNSIFILIQLLNTGQLDGDYEEVNQNAMIGRLKIKVILRSVN